MRLWLFIFGVFIPFLSFGSAPESYPVRGRVIDRSTRRPVAYAAVVVVGQEQLGASTDSVGRFLIERVRPGICRLEVSSLGYRRMRTPEYIVTASMPPVEIELEEESGRIESVTVTPSTFRRTAESPVSMRVIGLREIEKSPGSNRDISRIVRSYPGVSFSPVGYRNDLIVRGGGPSENRFFMDGIEIPNINHFATQGASGGPVSIVNADLVREIGFYTGAFPVDRAGGLSSVLDFTLRDGNSDRQTFKATVGASEIGASGSGHIGRRTTWLFSARRSYLQLLFKLLGLPFLPDYIDGQFKIKSRLSERDELTFMGLVGFDDMRLNTDEKDESARYLLSYLPRLRQETFTVGAVWRHYAGPHTQSVTWSHNYLNNRNLKYTDNDASSEENLMLRLRAVEQKSSLRFENRSYLNRWTVRAGAELHYRHYSNRTVRRLADSEARFSDYATRLDIVEWGLFAGADYASADGRLTLSAGLRADGSDYSALMARCWRQLSPRASLSYAFDESWSLSGSAGIYHQLPPFTALGFKDAAGVSVNRGLDYLRVVQTAAGVEWHLRDRLVVSMEGFYKRYDRIPRSLADGVPLTCKGDDYGSVGDEALVPTAQGRAFGAEWMVRWEIPGRLNAVGAFTWFRSEYRRDARSPYVASAWDNRFVANLSATYDFPRAWSVGAKLSAVGGAPYTPYDVERSALKEVWDAQGRAVYDYSRYNAGRLGSFVQLDIRIDKTFYFRRCMLGLYLDLQNVTVSKLRQPDAMISTGVVEDESLPLSEQRYRMKSIPRESGTLLPSVGLTVEF
ncbi:MAG: TonB-dependent receptor [Alistipes sp.]|nr:TonB-dependent receptor [Alistipes senegalensis]MCM1249613.1 TonB-dependent receptor [Alistipes sp.]